MSQITDEQVERAMEAYLELGRGILSHPMAMRKALEAALSTPPVGAETGETVAITRDDLAEIISKAGAPPGPPDGPIGALPDGHFLKVQAYKQADAVLAGIARLAPPRSDKANGDWVMVPREPTREMWAAMGNVLVGYKNRHHDKVAADLYAAILSASLVSQEAGE